MILTPRSLSELKHSPRWFSCDLNEALHVMVLLYVFSVLNVKIIFFLSVNTCLFAIWTTLGNEIKFL